MRINFNLSAFKTLKSYRNNIEAHSKSINNISTGKKVNSSKDNPNIVSKLQNFDKEMRGYQASRKNIQDAVSMTQTADSSIGNVSNMVNRLKEITVGVGNASIDGEQKEIIQKEVSTIIESINYEVENFSFNGVNILNDDSVISNENPNSLKFMSSSDVGTFYEVPTFNLTTDILGLDGYDITDKDFNLDNAISLIDNAHSEINSVRTKLGAVTNGFESSIDDSFYLQQTVMGAKSSIEDADIAFEMMDFSKTLLLNEVNIKTLNQTINYPKDFINTIGKLFK